eukprot:3655034-Prymnesium_polylepis.1
MACSGRRAYGICGACKRIQKFTDMVVCKQCRASVHCHECHARDRDGHICSNLVQDIDRTVSELKQSHSWPYCRLMFPSRLAVTDTAVHCVSITVLDAIREFTLPSSLFLGLSRGSANIITHHPRLVASAVLKELTRS